MSSERKLKKRLDLAIAEARVIPSIVAGMEEHRRNEAVSGVARSVWEAALALIEKSGSTVHVERAFREARAKSKHPASLMIFDHVEEQLPGLTSDGTR